MKPNIAAPSDIARSRGLLAAKSLQPEPQYLSSQQNGPGAKTCAIQTKSRHRQSSITSKKHAFTILKFINIFRDLLWVLTAS